MRPLQARLHALHARATSAAVELASRTRTRQRALPRALERERPRASISRVEGHVELHARPDTRIDRYRSALPDDPPGRLWAFYGSGWDTGQCYSDTGVLGPWTRAPTGNPRPIGNWSDGGPENPLVFRSRSGIYLLIWAANLLQVEHGLAFAWSKDGVNWEDNTGGGIRTGKAGYMIPVSPPGHVAFRTPLALVEHEERDNFFTLFFTAFENDHANPAAPIGGYENAYASEVELVLTF